MKKILSAVILAASLVAMSVAAFGVDSPAAKDAEAKQLNNIGISNPEGYEITKTDATGDELTTFEAANKGTVVSIVELSVEKNGAAYTGSLQFSFEADFAGVSDTADDFKAYTLTDGNVVEVPIDSLSAGIMTVTMPHFSPLCIVRVPNTGSVNTTPYIVAIVACVAALGAVLVIGKKRA